MKTDAKEFKSPLYKLVDFFQRSRDGWKAKHMDSKRKCKLLANQTRAVEKSRAKWREECKTLRRQVAKLEKQLSSLQKKQ